MRERQGSGVGCNRELLKMEIVILHDIWRSKEIKRTMMKLEEGAAICRLFD